MKINKQQLKQLIMEEMNALLSEVGEWARPSWAQDPQKYIEKETEEATGTHLTKAAQDETISALMKDWFPKSDPLKRGFRPGEAASGRVLDLTDVEGTPSRYRTFVTGRPAPHGGTTELGAKWSEIQQKPSWGGASEKQLTGASQAERDVASREETARELDVELGLTPNRDENLSADYLALRDEQRAGDLGKMMGKDVGMLRNPVEQAGATIGDWVDLALGGTYGAGRFLNTGLPGLETHPGGEAYQRDPQWEPQFGQTRPVFGMPAGGYDEASAGAEGGIYDVIRGQSIPGVGADDVVRSEIPGLGWTTVFNREDEAYQRDIDHYWSGEAAGTIADDLARLAATNREELGNRVFQAGEAAGTLAPLPYRGEAPRSELENALIDAFRRHGTDPEFPGHVMYPPDEGEYMVWQEPRLNPAEVSQAREPYFSLDESCKKKGKKLTITVGKKRKP